MIPDATASVPIAETEHYAVFEDDGQRLLKWKSDLGSDITSIDMNRPDKLRQHSYISHMLMPLVLIDAPRDVLLIGLGGGQQARFVHHNLPQLRMVAVEIDAVMVSLARQYFGLPPDDERLQVVTGDGAAFVAGLENQCDLLLQDAGGENNGIVDALHTETFYRDCHRALRKGGIMTVNVYRPAPDWGIGLLHMLQRIFDRVYGTTVVAGEQYVLTLCKDRLGPDWDAIAERAARMQPQVDLALVDFVGGFPRT